MKNYPGPRKVLGTVLQYSFFSVISRFPLKTVHPFRKFLPVLPVLPPPPYTKLKLEKKFWIHLSNIVCGVRGGVGLVWIGKRPRNAKVFEDFCPRLSKKEVGRKKKAILRGFQACKRVFSGFWWKIVVKQTFSQLFAVFWTCLMTLLETNIVVSHSACIIPKDNITFNKTHVRKQSREATSY